MSAQVKLIESAASCLNCAYFNPSGGVRCAVNPGYDRVASPFCHEFDRANSSKPRRFSVCLEVKHSGKWRSFGLDLVEWKGVIQVRGFTWENFRFNTESVEFVDKEGLGFGVDPVPSSLNRQQRVDSLPTLREFLEQHHYDVEKIRIDGLEIEPPKREKQIKTSDPRTVEVGLYKRGKDIDKEFFELEEIGTMCCPIDRVKSVIAAWEAQSPDYLACATDY